MSIESLQHHICNIFYQLDLIHVCKDSSQFCIYTIQIIVNFWEKKKKLLLLLFPCKNWLDLQVPIECLVEKETGLKGRYNWEPCQNSYGCKKNNPHSIIISSSKYTDEVPQSTHSYCGPHSLCNLKQIKSISCNGTRNKCTMPNFPSAKPINDKLTK